jgi:predicted dehydrogenase
MIRVVGDVHATKPGCPFWIHGTEGTIRGSILGGSDRVQLDRSEGVTNYPLEGQWFVDGFAGAMGELMCAIAEDREPEHSARDNIATLRLIGAARDSVEHGGASVQTDGLVL